MTDLIDAIGIIDMDFFTSPPYFGRYYGTSEATSFTSYYSNISYWLDPQDFMNTLHLEHRIHGASMRDDNESYYYIKRMIDEHVVEPKKFIIVNFDAHHDAFIHWKEMWYKSVDGPLHNYDNMVAPFVRNWIDHYVWVIPDCFTQEDISKQFENMSVSHEKGFIYINISLEFKIKIKIIRWNEYKNEYNWKFLCCVLNPELSRATPTMISSVTSHLSCY